MTNESNSQENHEIKNHQKSSNIGRLFWGLLLVLIGVLIILNNFQIVNVNWGNLWRLWRMIIIVAGLSMLSLKGWLWRVVTTIAIIGLMAVIVWAAVFQQDNFQGIVDIQKTVTQKIFGDIKRAEISLKAGAGSINIDSSNQTEIVNAELNSNLTKLEQTNSAVNGTQKINLSMKSVNYSWATNIKNDWNIYLTRDLPLSLSVDAGASSTKIDLSKAILDNLDINAGASNLDIKLGDHRDNVSLDIDAGASSIKLSLPKNSGVYMKVDGGLNSKNISDLVSAGDSVYKSNNYDQAKQKNNIVSKVGLSSLTVERY